jgi:uncharacterized protein YbaP (TraB family)
MMRLGAIITALALAAGTAAAEPAVWRVAGANGGEVFLLGSMHVLRASDHPLPSVVGELVGAADVIVMELDMDDIDAATQQRVVLRTATLAPGQRLADVLDAGVYRRLEQRSRELGIDLSLLQQFEPWFLAVTLLDLGMRKHGFEGERGVEQYVLGQAQARGKEIVGLETLEFQLGIFDSLPASSQQMMLEQTLDEIDEAETAMAAMATAWRDGELDTLSEELLADFAEFPGLYATLVTDRNEAWLDSLETLLDDGRKYLVVVGALHLVGRDNLIDLLKTHGYRVERTH